MKKQIIYLGCALLFLTGAPVHAQMYTPDKAGLEDGLNDSSGNWWQRTVLDRLFDFNLSPECWSKMTEKGGRGISNASYYTRDAGAYMNTMGWGDLSTAEPTGGQKDEEVRARLERMVDEAKDKLHFTLVANEIKCTKCEWDLIDRMFGFPINALAGGRWKPAGGSVFLTFTFSPKAKDISVKVAQDGKHFSIIAPSETEVGQWDDIILKGLIHARPSAAKQAPPVKVSPK